MGDSLGELDQFTSCGDVLKLINSKGKEAINNLSWKNTKPPIPNAEWNQIKNTITLDSNKMCDYIVDNSGNPTNKADCNDYVNKCKYKTVGPYLDLIDPTIIGKAEFANMNLTRIRIPDTVIRIEERAFYNNKLIKVRIPDLVEYIGEGAFAKNSLLTSVTIGKRVKIIGVAAFKETGLTEVIIPDSVISIHGYAFSTTKLISVNIPDYVMYIQSDAFANNKFLQSVTIGKRVAEISHGAFRENPLLTSIIIPDSVKIIGMNVFLNSGITSIIIPPSVEYINENAFRSMPSLKFVTIPETFKPRINNIFGPYRNHNIEFTFFPTNV